MQEQIETECTVEVWNTQIGVWHVWHEARNADEARSIVAEAMTLDLLHGNDTRYRIVTTTYVEVTRNEAL